MHSLTYLLSTLAPLFLLNFALAVPDISRFEVRSLPDGPSLRPSWAGRLPVPNTEQGNEIFFWLFKAENLKYDDNFIIWFNGGPGCSSLIGLTTGNGPISFDGNSTRLIANPYSWSQFGHVLYVDQPVGTGYSTASQPYAATTNDRVTSDFYAWLQSFFAHFPHLRAKQLHLMGESYAGIYVPYFASAIVANQDAFPINLRSMSLGDGSFGNPAAMSAVSVGKFLQSQQSRLQIPDDIMAVFSEADDTCGFSDVMQEAARFPPQTTIYIPGDPENSDYKRRRRRDLGDIANATCNINPTTPDAVRSSIMNSSCYGPCATFSTAMDYLGTVSASGAGKPCYDVYDISHDCSTINSMSLLTSYFRRADVQAALHLSPGTDNNATVQFSPCNSTILDILIGLSTPTAPVYSILPSLVTSHNISLHVYAGQYDMLLNHFGAELALQNMTWRGAQGFSQPITRPFFADNAAPRSPGGDPHPHPQTQTQTQTHPLPSSGSGSGTGSGTGARSRTRTCSCHPRGSPEAGRWVAERGVTYHLFWGAGHSVFASKPREMFAYVRDVVVAD
ncbi:hypothetical protein P175DRAFT_0505062 [Aspergillus ochraceoroseus IBT 24754]|uniref:Carboxypeptidase n=2 Tax=Aspergillus ochraceoroseus TaxID=138278 RepID=A0A2T5LLY9_9EURO|nr:uncharacterized protein P175DRAFT_0505062 [Aspergillus ochraceoroseus IBT 24754]KKK25347.1 hypothetical protein AOCH_000921 [Aspergillus ochraceoroseus]PTU17298.1 hypothetical protein P175DRAFT_0505062 [Aspergillus ochraceoroseus IBT 24754]